MKNYIARQNYDKLIRIIWIFIKLKSSSVGVIVPQCILHKNSPLWYCIIRVLYIGINKIYSIRNNCWNHFHRHRRETTIAGTTINLLDANMAYKRKRSQPMNDNTRSDVFHLNTNYTYYKPYIVVAKFYFFVINPIIKMPGTTVHVMLLLLVWSLARSCCPPGVCAL